MQAYLLYRRGDFSEKALAFKAGVDFDIASAV